MSVTKPILLDETGRVIADRLAIIASAINGSGKTIYGMYIDGSVSVPANKITYLKDAVGMTPAYMDYSAGKFNYGSWKDAFFMPRPCMLKFDGTVDYYLNPNDYTKKADGTVSDVADSTYEGNAMMEWGRDGRKIWYKIVPDNTNSAYVYIADHQADEDYHAWSFINNQGVLVDHFYTPIYTGSVDSNSKLRSLSGTTNCKSKNASQEITCALANNPSTDVLWYTEVYSDIELINFLLMLMGKSTDAQTVFGNGYYTGGSESTMLASGTMNDKGLFWGSNGSSALGVKVFGMENFWGNQWRRYAGHTLISGQHYVKRTYGIQDGSSASAYNTTGSGYIATGVSPTGTSGGYIKDMTFTENGMLPYDISGSSSTYFCDGHWFNNNTNYAYRGGDCAYSLYVGAFCLSLHDTASIADWDLGASLSCKPLA